MFYRKLTEKGSEVVRYISINIKKPLPTRPGAGSYLFGFWKTHFVNHCEPLLYTSITP
jgi:hypothetical protein